MVQAFNQKSQQNIQKKKCVSEFPILSALELFLCGLVVFIDMNMHIPTGDKDLKKHS